MPTVERHMLDHSHRTHDAPSPDCTYCMRCGARTNMSDTCTSDGAWRLQDVGVYLVLTHWTECIGSAASSVNCMTAILRWLVSSVGDALSLGAMVEIEARLVIQKLGCRVRIIHDLLIRTRYQ